MENFNARISNLLSKCLYRKNLPMIVIGIKEKRFTRDSMGNDNNLQKIISAK